MAGIAMLVGGAVVNALAFSGSNYLFSMMRSKSVAEEKLRHDKALEQLETAQAEWARKRQKRLDWINEELRRQGHSLHTFADVNEAIQHYNLVTAGKNQIELMEAKPELSEFYHPSTDQKKREIAFVALGMGVTGLVAYTLAK